MITRVFRVRIEPELRDTFEPLFRSVSLSSATQATGCRRVVIGGPTELSPNEYAMISEWDDAESLEAYVGSDWSKAYIPEGMAHFVDECWVHHYHQM